MEKGCVHIYTGDGKGKTTAALGLALRALGAGWRVFFAQFLKGQHTSEEEALARFGNQVAWRQYGGASFVFNEPSEEDRRLARTGWDAACQACMSGDYQLVVLDEIMVAMEKDMVTESELLDLIARRPPELELALTGRRAPPSLVEAADLVSEIRCVKHYMDGTRPSPRQGVEY